MTYDKAAIVVSGHTMALAVVRALGAAGVPVVVAHYDERDIAHKSRYATAELRTPNPEHHDALFVQALLEAHRRFRGSVLIPASDESLVALSRHKQELSEYYAVGCPEWDVTESFIDKARTYALAEACGVRAPRTIVPAAEADLVAGAEQIGFPLLLKPAKSHLFYTRFKRKMVRVASGQELRDAYRAAAAAGLQVMLQEIIPGDDSQVVNYNCYRHDGECLVEFTARQIRKAPPQFGSPRVVRSERIPEVVEPGREILSALGFDGFACVEFKRDARDGGYTLMEVNGRHNLSGQLAVRCGINFPLLHYKHLAQGEVPAAAADFATGIYWVDVFRDLGYSLGYVTTERYRPGQYLAPYIHPHCDAILDRRDLGPFWARSGYLLRHLSRTAGAAGASRSPLAMEQEAQ
jgi:D-aspartate ligase